MNDCHLKKRIENSCRSFLNSGIEKPRVGLVTGSGLSGLCDSLMSDQIRIDGNEVPGFPQVRVSGHSNEIISGRLEGVPVLAFCGRKHIYEKVHVSEVVYSVACLWVLGAQGVILTNAAGAVNRDFEVGQLMLIRDHIDSSFGRFAEELSGVISQLRSSKGNEKAQTALPATGRSPYDQEWFAKAKNAASGKDLSVVEGVYCFNRGPFYETPAEVRACRAWGADAVGMSTVPEALCGWQLGMKVLGVSCLTNMATGLTENAHTHEQVKQQAAKCSEAMKIFLRSLFRMLNEDTQGIPKSIRKA